MSSSPSTTRPVEGEAVYVGLGKRHTPRCRLARVKAVYEDHVDLVFADGKVEHYYFWEEIRHRTGSVNAWPVFEDWCEMVNPLDRMAIEIEDK